MVLQQESYILFEGSVNFNNSMVTHKYIILESYGNRISIKIIAK